MKTFLEQTRYLTDQSFEGKSFNGESVMSTLDGLSVEQALFIPKGQKRCAWEIGLHLAYWKHFLAALLEDSEEDSPYIYEKADWPVLPENPDQTAWDKAREVMRRVQIFYKGAVANMDQTLLDQPIKDWKMTWEEVLISMPSHDVYHTAQMRNMGIPDMEGE